MGYISETSDRKNFIWNMLGSSIFAAVSMILSFYAIRILGTEQGGVFAIAITISQMLVFIEYYETRTYQVTDVKNIYSFGQYKATKLILCIVMLGISICYMLIRERELNDKFMVVILMCAYRMIDGYADLYEGQFQTEGNLYLTGKSQAYRTILSAGTMMIMMFVTHNMIVSILVAIVVAIVGLYLFDINVMKEFHSVKADFTKERVIGILKECFPLFAGAFLWTYLLSASRMAIDSNMTSEYQSYYQTLFMPISVINLCVTFILKPALPKLAELYDKCIWNEFGKMIRQIVGVIISFTIVCVLGAYIIGIPVLSMIINYDLSEYQSVLVVLMVAGGVNSLSYFLYYLLTIMRNSKGILWGYLITSIITWWTSNYFVKQSGINGASLSFLLSVLIVMTIFGILFTFGVRNKKKRGEK